MNRSPWIVSHNSSSAPALRLFCFSFAGGGASVYREWPEMLPHNVEVLGIQLPARENRIAEAPLSQLSDVLRELAAPLSRMLDRPFVFFGHSLGALIAFETTRLLRRQGKRVPQHLFLSARRAAHLPLNRRTYHDLPDEQLIAEICRLKPTASDALANEELRALLLPGVRADFAINDTYRFIAEPPLNIPFSVLGGTDDSWVDIEGLQAWRELTTADTVVSMFKGEHFFVEALRREVLGIVAAKVRYLLLPRSASAAF
jgi:surfactin synthase thioesterase subunit